MLAPPPSSLSAPANATLVKAFTDSPLPSTWPDRSGLRLLFALLRAPFVRGGIVEIPDALPGPPLPEYVKKPFHGLPNGYYSHSVAEGYDTGFELSMLGRIKKARLRVVNAIDTASNRKPTRVLDAGCGTARLAHAWVSSGVPEVWGIDPSPYLLQIAQRRTPQAHLVQGVLEEASFEDESFDAAGACFLFHELPRAAAEACAQQLHRILRPGGLLALIDPCPDHVRPRSLLRLVSEHGFAALYFHFLAKGVYEPFLGDWHGLGDRAAWLSSHGFEILENDTQIPLQFLLARRLPG